MALIDDTIFEGFIALPNLNDEATLSLLDSEINRLQDDFLRSVFGFKFQKSMLAQPTEQRFDAILNGYEFTDLAGVLQYWDGLNFPLSKYVYYHYIIDNNSSLTGVGYVKPNTENSTVLSPVSKPVGIYNLMVQELTALKSFLDSKTFDYTADDLIFSNYIKINSFGI